MLLKTYSLAHSLFHLAPAICPLATKGAASDGFTSAPRTLNSSNSNQSSSLDFFRHNTTYQARLFIFMNITISGQNGNLVSTELKVLSTKTGDVSISAM